MTIRTGVAIYLGFLGSIEMAQGQYSLEGFALDQDLGRWYDKTIKIENAGLFEGAFYKIEFKSPTSHVFYKESRAVEGSIVFNGQEYKEVNLLYDIQKDLIILLKKASTEDIYQPILLSQKQIESFNIYHSRFRNYPGASTPPEGPGFYEVLIEDDLIQLLVKRRKIEKIEVDHVDYYPADHYFIKYNESYYELKTRRSLYKAFPEYKPQIKEVIRSLGFKSIRLNGEGALVHLILNFRQMLAHP